MRLLHASLTAFVMTAAGTTLALAALPNGVAAGDTTATSVLLWTRSTDLGNVSFEIATDQNFANIVFSAAAQVVDTLRPVKVEATGLLPNTRYFYRATDSGGAQVTGRFKTAAQSGFAGLRFGVSGDWRGELAPFPAVANADGRDLDFWYSHGDTIYADFPSPAVPVPQATTLPEFRTKHAEIYTERFGLNTFADLRRTTSTFAGIDDHEVTNDFAGGAPPASDPRFAGQPGAFINETTLYNVGLTAFHDYHPIRVETYGPTGDPRTAGKLKLYRARRFGADAAFFAADARSFRDPGLPAANPLDAGSVLNYLVSAFNPARSMLGRAQVDELKADLLAAQRSGVTWKFIAIPEPTQNLGVVGASDRFEGYAAERSEILRFIVQNKITNVVFIAADIHGTLVNNLKFQNLPGGPQLETYSFEITTGSVAFDAPFGPTVAGLAATLNLPGALPLGVYLSLPPAQQEAYVQGLINAQVTPLGYDPIGLNGSRINATLLQGGYSATNTFGWTEFEVDASTQNLLVSTYGISSYTETQLLANPALITNRTPALLTQFRVVPAPTPCTADVDDGSGNGIYDGGVGIEDLLYYLAVYNAGSPIADVDDGSGSGVPNGGVSLEDLLYYLARYDIGC